MNETVESDRLRRLYEAIAPHDQRFRRIDVAYRDLEIALAEAAQALERASLLRREIARLTVIQYDEMTTAIVKHL